MKEQLQNWTDGVSQGTGLELTHHGYGYQFMDNVEPIVWHEPILDRHRELTNSSPRMAVDDDGVVKTRRIIMTINNPLARGIDSVTWRPAVWLVRRSPPATVGLALVQLSWYVFLMVATVASWRYPKVMVPWMF